MALAPLHTLEALRLTCLGKDAEFESKHPRDGGGKFTEGGADSANHVDSAASSGDTGAMADKLKGQGRTKADIAQQVAASVANHWLAFAERSIAEGKNPAKLSEHRDNTRDALSEYEAKDWSPAEITRVHNDAVAYAKERLLAGDFPTVREHFRQRAASAVDPQAVLADAYKRSDNRINFNGVRGFWRTYVNGVQVGGIESSLARSKARIANLKGARTYNGEAKVKSVRQPLGRIATGLSDQWRK